MKTSQNRADEKESQTAFDSAKKESRNRENIKRSYSPLHPKDFEERNVRMISKHLTKKTSVAFTMKSANYKIMKSKIYHKTIIDFDKKK